MKEVWKNPITVALITAALLWLGKTGYDMNTMDSEIQPLEYRVQGAEEVLKEQVEINRALKSAVKENVRQQAQQTIRATSKNISRLSSKPSLNEAERKELEQNQAQNDEAWETLIEDDPAD